MHPGWRGVLVAVLAAASPLCRAGDGFGVGGGVSHAIEGERTLIVTVSWLGATRHPWELSAGYLGRRERVDQGSATVFLALSKRLTWRRWFATGGIAVTDTDTEVLSGHGQFYTGAGYQAEAWSLSLRHFSNGDTGGRNRGETFLLLEHHF